MRSPEPPTILQSVRRVAAALRGTVQSSQVGTPQLAVRQAVVTAAVAASGSSPAHVQIQIGGVAASVPARYHAAYAPAVGDTVFVLHFGADLIVLGKLA